MERTKTTDFLKRVVKAYIDEYYDGNLIDILTWGTSKNTKSIAVDQVVLQALKKHYNISDLMEYQKIFQLPNIYINNRKLDGFLDYFVKHYECDKRVCGIGNYDGITKESSCEYCKQWSRKAISYNVDEIQEWKMRSEKVLKSMVESSIYGKKTTR